MGFEKSGLNFPLIICFADQKSENAAISTINGTIK